VLYKAAMAGDTKAAETILKHKCDWVAKQQIEVNQTISITAALQEAQLRVINMGTIDEAPTNDNSTGPLINNREKDGDDYPNSNARPAEVLLDYDLKRACLLSPTEKPQALCVLTGTKDIFRWCAILAHRLAWLYVHGPRRT